MKKAWLLLLAMVVSVGLVIPALASNKVFYWRHEGTSPFWKTPLRSEEDLKALFDNKTFKSKLAKRLQSKESGWNGTEVVNLAENTVRNGEFDRVVIQPGSDEAEFEWMLAGENWKTNEGMTVLWDGDHPLTAYRVPINYRGENIDLYFGNHCVNVLKKRRRAEVPPGDYGVKPPPPRVETPLPPQYVQPPAPVDVCPNIEGVQTVVPQGLMWDAYGNCVIMQAQVVDVCANIEGVQTIVPFGMVPDGYGNCVESIPPPPPPVLSPFVLSPFSYYGDDSYSPRDYQPRDYQQRGYQQRGYQQRGYQQRGYQQRGYQQRGQQRHYQQKHYQQKHYQQKHYQQRVRPPTVHTRSPVQTPSVRPPTVRTR